MIAAWKNQIKMDVPAYADAGTTVDWRDRGSALSGAWQCNGAEITAVFSCPGEDVEVTYQGRRLSYAAFLSVPEMGDLYALAKAIARTRKAGVYVDTRASLSGTEARISALELLEQVTDGGGSVDSTRVVFVKGDAGAGKTCALQELVRRKAEQYVRGESAYLFLYINAQGRALARFDEALATELQDLKARLTYHCIPSLARVGAVIPVIDGFDELLGVSGYDDAFSSLRRFLEELAGRGVVVASARSTYYEQEFLQRALAVPQSWQLTAVDVAPWTASEFERYIVARHEHVAGKKPEVGDFRRAVSALFKSPTNRDLAQKPLFVAKGCDMVLAGVADESSGMIDLLVRHYVERERTEKLLDSNHTPYLTSEQVVGLLVFVAEELWTQETRELDLRSLSNVFEVYLSGQDLAEEGRTTTIQRAGKFAFLSQGRTANRVAFEHEVFFSYFLGKCVASAIAGGPSESRSVLMRGLLPPDCPAFAADDLRREALSYAKTIDVLCAAAETDTPRAQQVKENGGALALASARLWGPTLRGREIGSREMRQLVFGGQSLAGLDLEGISFRGCEFRRADLSLCRIADGSFADTLLYETVVSTNSTRLEVDDLDVDRLVVGLRVRQDSTVVTVYSPAEVRKQLRGIGVKGIADGHARVVRPELVELVESTIAAFSGRNTIWTADDRHQSLLRNDNWEFVKDGLLQFGLVSRMTRSQKGTPRECLRLEVGGGHVMAGVNREASVPPQVEEFWTYLESKGKKG